MPQAADALRWVLLVTDGTVIEYPPEVYRSEDLAQSEAERWAWILSGGGWTNVDRPFEGRWEVGDKWVRLVESFANDEGDQLWVGTYWTRDGAPDPDAELFPSRDAAREWALDPVPGALRTDLHETPWYTGATYLVHGKRSTPWFIRRSAVCRAA